MAKSPDAFRTISEVAEWLGIQAHVLRFWESKFTQVKPIKRAGGRRYYRPGDMLLLGGIKKLLYEDGLTIKGVQKILREEGMSHVVDMSGPLDELTLSQIGDKAPIPEAPLIQMVEPEEEPRGVVLNFENGASEPAVAYAPQPTETKADTADDSAKDPATADASASVESKASDTLQATSEDTVTAAHDDEPSTELEAKPEPEQQASPEAPAPSAAEPDTILEDTTPDDNAVSEDVLAAEPAKETETASKIDEKSRSETDATPVDAAQAAEPVAKSEPDTAAALPAFMRRPPTPDADAAPKDTLAQEAPKQDATEPEASPKDAPVAKEQPLEPAPAKPTPRKIDMPRLTPEAEIAAAPALLTSVYRTRHIDRDTAAKIAPLLDRLTAHRDSMSARRNGGGAPAPKT